MDLRIIKTQLDHKNALGEVERLIMLDPELGTVDANRLEILSLLIENFEKEHFPIERPDPISAIKFVMEQKGLSRSDLTPYIGSKAKVSEVLNGNRPLSKRMMRRLHEGLGIPADILLKEPSSKLPQGEHIEWERFPIASMRRRGWFGEHSGTTRELKEYAEENIRPMMENMVENCFSPVLPRSSASLFKTRQSIDRYALAAWQAKVVAIAVKNNLNATYSINVKSDFMRQIAQLTVFDNGPILARERLNGNGIHLIIVPHLEKTYLDGAAMLLKNEAPVIALTLRHNRLDNFWFSLLHELAHVIKHLKHDDATYFDDFDYRESDKPNYEIEANSMASEALIPKSLWSPGESFKAINYKPSKIKNIAKDLKVHESILVGRIQYDTDNYRLFPSLLGRGMPGRILRITIN